VAFLFCTFSINAQDLTTLSTSSGDATTLLHEIRKSYDFVDATEATQILKNHLSNNYSPGDEDTFPTGLEVQYFYVLSSKIEASSSVRGGLTQLLGDVSEWNMAVANPASKLDPVTITNTAIGLLKR